MMVGSFNVTGVVWLAVGCALVAFSATRNNSPDALLFISEFGGYGGVIFGIMLFFHQNFPKEGPQNTHVHGAAKPASETEAQAAARGTAKANDVHDEKFPD